MECLIVDDDPLICDLLNHFCSKVEMITSVTTTNSGFESINLINQKNFGLVLLDYNLPDITGKEILQLVGQHTAVIMITANKDFASESYEYDQIVDFLVKPITFARFFKGIQKAQKFLSGNEQSESQLFIKDGNKLVKVDLNEVLYIRSAANYVQLVLAKKKILTLMTLKEIEQKLPGYFQKVHRSYIVNVNKIDTIATGELKINDEEISISDSYEKELLKKINLLN
ncbi:LytTR family DNA-binding domain-containing protein [Reichenbachiella sp. MALMAid0571]|uniref:LytR/AlgR family response regulator transcription factor n=1 Tax=Reichenbachiella sp. MALMAid0571 TaxID=3143939 RepID=UPI0032DE6F01